MRELQRGQAIVLLALMMAVLVGFVALAIDSARAFDNRRILQDSVDAASLAAAESYQAGANWGAAQAGAMTLFEHDNRFYGGDNCPAGAFATPVIGTPVTTNCTVSGTDYLVHITAADNAAAGQSFAFSATHSIQLALMQVLSGSQNITIQAAGAALANDQSQAPALGGLSTDGSCPGGAGAVPPIHIENKTNFMTVLGDVVSNGSFSMGGLSYLHLAGNSLTRCAAPINADHVVYECWRRGETPSPGCAADEQAGSLSSTANRFADPRYVAATTAGGSNGVTSNVVLQPGIYTADPNSNRCYFLAAGVYEWQGGLTVSGGLISNELKPPSEAGASQFWADGHCAGSFTLTHQNGPNPLPAGNYAVVVTSARTDNGYARESAPSACATVAVGNGEVVQLAISNVPGAVSYNVYSTVVNGTCAGPFNLVSGALLAGAQSNSDVSTCPNPAGAPTCTLGHVSATYNNLSTTNPALHPPGSEVGPFVAGKPNQNAARAISPTSLSTADDANENLCTSGGAAVYCPILGTKAVNPALLTPGAVEMKYTQGSCLNVLGGDAFVFSGYQYNWIVNHQPSAPLPACTTGNNWTGVTNSAAIGLTYTPQAAFTISGDNTCSGGGGTCDAKGGFQAPTGGILAANIHIIYASGLLIDFDPRYAPSPPGARLIA